MAAMAIHWMCSCSLDESAFPGCKLTCRIVGLIEGEQGDKKRKERNDRVVAVENENHSFTRVRHVDDLGKHFEEELEEFSSTTTG